MVNLSYDGRANGFWDAEVPINMDVINELVAEDHEEFGLQPMSTHALACQAPNCGHIWN